MLKRSLARWIVLPVTLVAVGWLLGQRVLGAESITAQMGTFTNTDGVSSFALSVKPTAIAATTSARDIVVLFNTSASQIGESRTKAFDALKGLLGGLNAGDRVRLVAVDLNAVPLTQTFVAPNSKEMEAALAALDARVPLGATDMAKAVEAVVGSYGGESKNARAAVYIGDGRSAAHLLETDEFQKLSARLADSRIPLSSYAVGVRLDRQLLGALAVQTGGAVIVESETSGQEAGRSLATAADATVLWPTSVTWPAEVTSVFPKRMPPLRNDRDTIVLGTLKGKDPLEIQLDVAGAAGPEKIAMTVSPGASDERNTYLAQLVERARVDGGVTMPLVGSASLEEARQAVNSGVRNIDRLAQQALAGGNVDGAEKLIGEALRQDPNDSEALSLKGAVAKRKQAAGANIRLAAAEPPPATGGLKPPPPPTPAGNAAGDLNLVGPPAAEEPPAGTLAEGFQHERRVVAQMMQAEVMNVLNKSRSLMSTDPELAAQSLRMELEKVRQVPQLDPDVRDQFVDSLQGALREASVRKAEVEQQRQQRLESKAIASERLLAAKRLERAQMTMKELFERFNALLAERNYAAADDISKQAEREMPSSPTAIVARTEVPLVGNYENFWQLRIERQKAVVDTLFCVEKSQVPFPDDQPIVYPDAEWWQQMTVRRKDKYSSMDLAKKGSAEKRIDDALKSPTEVVFVEAPLTEVLDYLKDRHKIEIQIDTRALEDVGIGTDSPVTVDLKGISLRSALRLMLKKLNLTYLVDNEVLLITTPEEAENHLTTKVYPVADLVLPIPQNSMMGGMGGMMGGMGGMGGGMGGMMGGMGGGMGGMGGGMGGMMGGGMFNMPGGLLPKVPQGGFQAFAVKDDLSVPAKGAADERSSSRTVPTTIETRPAEAGNVPAKIDNRPAKIEIEIEEGAKPEVVWDGYFAKNIPQPKAVRIATRRLMNQRKYDHVIALIGAALRHRQCQPWMYEGLALAMEAAGRPKADIERAIMSAVDFVDNTTDLMYVGAYLSKMGLDERIADLPPGRQPRSAPPRALHARSAGGEKHQ